MCLIQRLMNSITGNGSSPDVGNITVIIIIWKMYLTVMITFQSMNNNHS